MDRLLRRIVHFEATPEATPEASAPEPEAPAPEAEAPVEEWSGPSQEDWNRVNSTLESLGPLAELAQQGGFDPDADFGQDFQQQQPQEIPDPQFEPERYAEWLSAQVDARVQQTLEPWTPFLQQTADRTNTETLNGAVDALAPNFDFLQGDNAEAARSAVIDQARAIVNSGQEQDGERAMQMAAERVQGLIALGKQQGRDEYLASLNQQQPGAREPGIAGGAVEGTPQSDSYDEVFDRFLSGNPSQV